MLEIFKILIKEIKIFIKSNWWIFVIFVLCLAIIYNTNTGNIFEISIVFILHFLGDLFVMMMAYYFSVKNNNKRLFFQILQSFIFTLLGFYAGFSAWKWHYLLPQIVFILPAIKWYFLEFKGKNIKFLNWKLSFLLNLWIILINFYLGLLTNIFSFIQILWFAFFSIGLILIKEKQKYIFSLVWIFFITLWWLNVVIDSFLISNIKWIDISYTLLPLTVLVFYIKNFKKFIN